jgi:hypothetical protein
MTKEAAAIKKAKSREKSQDEVRLTKAKADKAELEVRELKGELIPYDEVRELILELSNEVKRRFEGLPQALARRLSYETDANAIEKILSAEVYSILQVLARVQGEELKVTRKGRAIREEEESEKAELEDKDAMEDEEEGEEEKPPRSKASPRYEKPRKAAPLGKPQEKKTNPEDDDELEAYGV